MALDIIYQWMKRLKAVVLTPDNQTSALLIRRALVTLMGTSLLMAALLTFRAPVPDANANALRVSPTASCSRLARLDPTISNGASWGRTILPGHGAPGGWFGVDVCSNGFNSVSPNGSNVSCDSTSHGCSPTNDGYGWTFQCPELIVRFSAWAFGDNPGAWGRSGWGNAPDLWLPVNHPADFVMYPNGSRTAPVPGDILVWGSLDSNGHPWPAGPDGAHGGHIAVVAAVKNGKVITAEQNVKWGSEDHPTDTLALTKVGSRWILSGSSQPATTLPTWRWLRTMGHSRGTFGWLHSVKNNGHFPSTGAKSATAQQKTTSSKPISQQFPGGLPSLSAATVVTQSGTLADLTWSTRSFFTPSTDTDQPEAQSRSLGTPADNVRLASGQSVATLLMNDGSRYSYALGTDGGLYVARTSPNALGVFWNALGQPSGVRLTGSPVASLFAGGVQIAARGDDGYLWWRAGPPDRPGNWVSLGRPSATTLTGGLALAGAPGAGSPLAFAVGANGRIYLRIWLDATTAADGTQIPAAWSDWLSLGAQSAASHITGALLVVPELPNAHNWIGLWPDSPLNVLATDSAGALWWFRSVRLANGWAATQVAGNPVPLSALLGAVAVPAAADASNASSTAPSAATIQVYAAAHSASYMATLALSSNGTSSIDKPAWATLSDPPAGVNMSAPGAAVALGPGNSVLVAPAGDSIVLGGIQAMTEALLPVVAPQIASGAKNAKNTNPWAQVGVVPAPATFSDSFASAQLDTRWTRSDASVRAKPVGNGLTLTPGIHNIAGLTQAASPGDVTLTVEVAKPSTLPRSAGVGMALYLDDGDWLMLLVDRAGSVRLCAMAQQASQPCATGKVAANAAVWLSIQRVGSTFTALASNDDLSWHRVGQWTPTINGAAPATQTPTATARTTATPRATATATALPTVSPTAGAAPSDPIVAPLAFTSWGVLAIGNGDTSGWPRLANFTVTSAP